MESISGGRGKSAGSKPRAYAWRGWQTMGLRQDGVILWSLFLKGTSRGRSEALNGVAKRDGGTQCARGEIW